MSAPQHIPYFLFFARAGSGNTSATSMLWPICRPGDAVVHHQRALARAIAAGEPRQAWRLIATLPDRRVLQLLQRRGKAPVLVLAAAACRD